MNDFDCRTTGLFGFLMVVRQAGRFSWAASVLRSDNMDGGCLKGGNHVILGSQTQFFEGRAGNVSNQTEATVKQDLVEQPHGLNAHNSAWKDISRTGPGCWVGRFRQGDMLRPDTAGHICSHRQVADGR